MNRKEFINLIINEKRINKKIYKISLEIEDFPSAREVLNKLSDNYMFEELLNSKSIIQTKDAQAAITAKIIYLLKDPLIKSETQKFINDLVDQKLGIAMGENTKTTKQKNITEKSSSSKNSRNQKINPANDKRQGSQGDQRLLQNLANRTDNGFISLFIGLLILTFLSAIGLLFNPLIKENSNKKSENNISSLKDDYNKQQQTKQEKLRKCERDLNNSWLYGDVDFFAVRYLFNSSDRTITLMRSMFRGECIYLGTYKLDKVYKVDNTKVQFSFEGNELVEYVKFSGGNTIRYVRVRFKDKINF